MKQCPKCSRTYADPTLNFCLDDGEWLREVHAADEPATEVLNSEAPTRIQNAPAASPTCAMSKHTGPGRKPLTIAAVGLLIVAALGAGGYWFYADRAGSQIRSIAVLPFANESGNQELEYVSDGLAETLIYRLSQVPQIRVSPRSSVFRYKGKQTEPVAAGIELGADAVLSGVITQRGDNLVVNVELIDVRHNNLIWGDRFDGKPSDLLATQREIAAKIAESLRIKMSGTGQQSVAKQYTTSSEAYQLYLRGRYHFGKRADTELRQAMEYFERAIAADPDFALAYTGLADCYSLLPIYDRTGNAKAVDTMPLAKDAVLKAISIDDSLAEAHASLGLIYDTFDWNTTAAEKEYRRAIDLNPNYASAHQWYGEMLSNLGRFDEGLAESRRAIEAEPFSLPANFAYGLNLYKARRYDEAIAQFNRLFELALNYTHTNDFLFETYAAKGDRANAVNAYITQKTLNGEPTKELEKLRTAFEEGGWHAFLRERIRFIESNPSVKLNADEVSCIYAWAGNKDKALEWLDRAYERKDEGLTWLLVAPRYDGLRDDPRFQDLISRVGFAD